MTEKKLPQLNDSNSGDQIRQVARTKPRDPANTRIIESGKTHSRPPSKLAVEDLVYARDLGVRIGLVRIFNGLDRKSCAMLLGCTRKSLQLIESGKRYPSVIFLVSYCRLMNASADFIMGLVEPDDDNDK